MTDRTQVSTETDAEANMSLAFLEGQSDVWAARINLHATIENIVSPMRLKRSAPDGVRASFTKRMKEQIDAIVRQAFIEGAARAMDGFAHDSEVPPEARNVKDV